MKSWIKNKKIVLFVMGMLLATSIYGYQLIPKQEAPDITAPFAIITTVYPGASMEDVEQKVTSVIEGAVMSLEDYDYCQSYSNNNVSVVVLSFAFQSDLSDDFDELNQLMEDIQDRLPDECGKISVNDNVMETAGIIISLSGEAYSYEELGRYAERIQKEITKLDGISRFDVAGKPEKQILVTLDNSKLAEAGLTYQRVVDLIRAQNVAIPLGSLEVATDHNETTEKIQLHIDYPITTLEELENVVVGGDITTRQVVLLKDIATIEESYEENNYIIKHNGKNAVLLSGYFQKNQNIMLVGKDVEDKINELKGSLPSDLLFSEVNFLPIEVANSVDNFLFNLITGILLVIVVVFVGLGIRNAIIVSTAIPASILLTFLVMPLFNMKIHQVTIAGLIVALGMLVDNAIVVSDAIQVRIDQGEDRLLACVNGAKEVLIPILTSTLTTIAAFSPLLFLNSIAGEYVKALPQVVIISLIASFLVATLITPMIAFIFFRPTKKQKVRKHRIRMTFEWLLKGGLRRPKTVLLLLVIVLSGAVYLALQLNIIFFPKADKDILYMDIHSSFGEDIQKTEEVTEQIMDILSTQKEVETYTAAIGNGLPRFYDTLSVYTMKENFSQIFMRVDLSDSAFNNNSEYSEYLQSLFDHSAIDAKVAVKQLEYIDPRGSTIGVRVSGESVEEVKEAAMSLREALLLVPGAIMVSDDLSGRNTIYDIQVDESKAILNGLLQADIQNETNIAIMGRESTTLLREDELSVIVKSDVNSQESLKSLTLTGSLGFPSTTLGDIAIIEEKEKDSTIRKYNGEYSAYIGCEVAGGTNKQSVQDALQEIVDSARGYNVHYKMSGESEKISEYFGEVGVLAVFAAILIYLILLTQFKSFRQPIVILSTIPLSVVGSVVGLYISKQPISFTAALGIVSLMGVVVNNAIILLDYINYEKGLGKDTKTACLDAVEQRFRPIMLTTVTTIIGLLPLAFSESQLFKPMSIALMSGLMVATLLTLVIIPIIYMLMIRDTSEKNRSE